MSRYVPKTYNNRRLLRIIIISLITLALSAVTLFLILFFVFQTYFEDGELHVPWLVEEEVVMTPTPTDDADMPADDTEIITPTPPSGETDDDLEDVN